MDERGDGRLRVLGVTGTRAEFGLLAPVFEAISASAALELRVAAAGAHLLKPSETWREVAGRYEITARVEMQRAGETGWAADMAALGRGVSGFATVIERERPGWVLVLGDRIEAYAAASAAAVGGVRVAHLHGGDRAEGVADEAMRHAITKLAHLHLPATAGSAERIVRMGEAAERVEVVGSPAACGIEEVEARLADGVDERVRAIVQMHPCGLEAGEERAWSRAVVDGVLGAMGEDERAVVLAPNRDPGHDVVRGELARAVGASDRLFMLEHLPHGAFRSLVKWLGERGGSFVGNSSAGLIEAPMLGCASVDVGPRQGGRERPGSVGRVEARQAGAVEAAVREARSRRVDAAAHPYGDGRTGERVARLLWERRGAGVRKRNAY